MIDLIVALWNFAVKYPFIVLSAIIGFVIPLAIWIWVLHKTFDGNIPFGKIGDL